MKRFLILIALLAGPLSLNAQELVTLTTPFAPPSVTLCRLSTVILNLDASSIQANLTCPNGQPITKIYDAGTTPTGATLLHSLNIGNFSGATSMIHAVYNRLTTDAVITGVVSGVPQ